MKEKRVDVFLAAAGFFQMIFIGFGGAFLNEFIKPDAEKIVMHFAFWFAVLFGIIAARFYVKAHRLTKKNKKRIL